VNLFYLLIFVRSKSCYSPIHALRCIRPYLHQKKTASTIATSIVHSKLDYCNSFYNNFPNFQLHRLQLIQNSLARTVFNTLKTCHITRLLASLHWLKITSQATYLHNLVSLKSPSSPCVTRSSSIATLSWPESWNERNLVSWFSGKLIKLLPPDVRFYG